DALYPLPGELLAAPPKNPSLFARDVSPVQVLLASDEQWRKPVALHEISQTLIEATIAVEDQRFRQHVGVDPLAILRAVKQNALSGRTLSGASTLTMQLVKMQSRHLKRNLANKLNEAFRALQLERELSKDQILELYLNVAPYVGNHRGIESASLALFAKHAADLSQAEAYLLAGLPQSPTFYNPNRRPKNALARREMVLAAAVQTGQLDEEEARRISNTRLTFEDSPRSIVAPHFARLAFNARPAGGRTTLDTALQQRCEQIVQEHSARLPEGNDIALIVIELETGAVRALIGSADVLDPIDGQVNGATAWRSPGSALKPFLYAAAFEAGLATPKTQIDDSPMELAGWTPGNFEGDFSGSVSATDALRRSLNIPAMRIARLAGLTRTIGVLESSGVRFRPGTAQAAGLALATGAAEVRLIDLTNAYATLGRNGTFKPWVLFEDQTDTPLAGNRVLSEKTCDHLHGMLSTRKRFEAARQNAHHFCWKTGTSSGFRDAWSLGHDDQYAVGIWVGNFSGTGHPAFVGSQAATPMLTDVFLGQ
ncbi:MAG: penicillin-binding protein 1C, partial [Planctomycetes bacterium]|nr:penicillin-binding protein 1C [Planctomycetota bacterium]